MAHKSYFKVKQYRNQDYLKYVSEMPSCISGLPSDDAHHIKCPEIGGGSVKPSDLFVIPLTRIEHTYFHQVGRVTWEMRYGSQLGFALKTIDEAIRNGFTF